MWMWTIHYWEFEKGKRVGEGRYFKGYKRKGNAIRVAKKRYGDPKRFRWHLVRTRFETQDDSYEDIKKLYAYYL